MAGVGGSTAYLDTYSSKRGHASFEESFCTIEQSECDAATRGMIDRVVSRQRLNSGGKAAQWDQVKTKLTAIKAEDKLNYHQVTELFSLLDSSDIKPETKKVTFKVLINQLEKDPELASSPASAVRHALITLKLHRGGLWQFSTGALAAFVDTQIEDYVKYRSCRDPLANSLPKNEIEALRTDILTELGFEQPSGRRSPSTQRLNSSWKQDMSNTIAARLTPSCVVEVVASKAVKELSEPQSSKNKAKLVMSLKAISGKDGYDPEERSRKKSCVRGKNPENKLHNDLKGMLCGKGVSIPDAMIEFKGTDGKSYLYSTDNGLCFHFQELHQAGSPALNELGAVIPLIELPPEIALDIGLKMIAASDSYEQLKTFHQVQVLNFPPSKVTTLIFDQALKNRGMEIVKNQLSVADLDWAKEPWFNTSTITVLCELETLGYASQIQQECQQLEVLPDRSSPDYQAKSENNCSALIKIVDTHLTSSNFSQITRNQRMSIVPWCVELFFNERKIDFTTAKALLTKRTDLASNKIHKALEPKMEQALKKELESLSSLTSRADSSTLNPNQRTLKEVKAILESEQFNLFISNVNPSEAEEAWFLIDCALLYLNFDKCARDELAYFEQIYKDRVLNGEKNTVKVFHSINDSLSKIKTGQRPVSSTPLPSAEEVAQQKIISELASEIPAAQNFEQLSAAYKKVCQLPEDAQAESRALIHNRLSEVKAGEIFKASNTSKKITVGYSTYQAMLNKPGYCKHSVSKESEAEQNLEYSQMLEAAERLKQSTDPLEIRMCYIAIQSYKHADEVALIKLVPMEKVFYIPELAKQINTARKVPLTALKLYSQPMLNNLLFRAAKIGDLNLIKRLLSAGANINAVNSAGQTILMVAANTSNDELVEYLISKGTFDLSQTDNHKRNIYHYLCSTKLKDKSVDALLALKIPDCAFTQKDIHGNTPFQYSVVKLSSRLMLRLASLGAPIDGNVFVEKTINGEKVTYSYSVVEYAIREKSVSVLQAATGKTLKSKCGNLTMLDNDEESYLHLAVKVGDIPVLDFLFRTNEIAPTQRGNNDRTLVHSAVKSSNSKEVIYYLIKQGIPLDEVDLNGDNPAMFAAKTESIQELETLIYLRAYDDKELNCEGLSVVHLCVMNKLARPLRSLAKNGADFEKKVGKAHHEYSGLSLKQLYDRSFNGYSTFKYSKEIIMIIENKHFEQKQLIEMERQQAEIACQQKQVQQDIEVQLAELRQAAANNLSRQTEFEATWRKGIEMSRLASKPIAEAKFDSDLDEDLEAKLEEDFNKSLSADVPMSAYGDIEMTDFQKSDDS